MKILAQIPVEKIIYPGGTYTYRNEEMEVEVVRLMRYRADRTRERYYYEADVIRPAQTHPEYQNFGPNDGTFRVSITRSRNPKWKPPQFPAGVHVINLLEP